MDSQRNYPIKKNVWALAFMLLLLIFVTGIVSAGVSCTPTSISTSYVQGTSKTHTIICTNNNVNLSSDVGKIGDFFQINKDTIPSGSSETITLDFFPSAQVGTHSGFVYFSDGSPVYVEAIVSSSTECQLNPSIISYTQAFQQGTEAELPKIIFNPSGCSGDFSITNAYVTGGVVVGGIHKPVYIKEITGANEIILGVNTENLVSKTYNVKLTVVTFGKTFLDISNINVVVTTGTDPSGGFNLDQLPSCSLSQSNLGLNQTYSLICSNLQPDITIVPESDEKFIIGIGVERTANQHIWYFKPINIGETYIKSKFFYLGNPVGNPYIQTVNIRADAGQIPGTNLKFLFNPNLNEAGPKEQVTIQLVDNKTNSLVENALVFVDSELLNTTDGYSYYWVFKPEKNYTFRGKATGYNDLIENFVLGVQPISVLIKPDGQKLETTLISISTPDVNASLFINERKVMNPYSGYLPYGNNTLKAISEGYYQTIEMIFVDFGVKPILLTDWKKGKEQVIEFQKNVSYTLSYKKDSLSFEEDVIQTGESNSVAFKPNKKGIYILKVDNIPSWEMELKGFNWSAKWWFMTWYWWFVFIAIIVFGYIILNSSKKSSSSSSMGGMINYS